MVQKDTSMGYFLGANSGGGFHSLYEGWMGENASGVCYILKGGPGCGKSTLMKTVGERLQALGWEAEYIWCSGDPDSLDGVRFPEKGVEIADGTAPHAEVTKGHLGGNGLRIVNMERKKRIARTRSQDGRSGGGFLSVSRRIFIMQIG